jgi:hypothetical protein
MNLPKIVLIIACATHSFVFATGKELSLAEYRQQAIAQMIELQRAENQIKHQLADKELAARREKGLSKTAAEEIIGGVYAAVEKAHKTIREENENAKAKEIVSQFGRDIARVTPISPAPDVCIEIKH